MAEGGVTPRVIRFYPAIQPLELRLEESRERTTRNGGDTAWEGQSVAGALAPPEVLSGQNGTRGNHIRGFPRDHVLATNSTKMQTQNTSETAGSRLEERSKDIPLIRKSRTRLSERTPGSKQGIYNGTFRRISGRSYSGNKP
jgi:hypothetical protein